MHMYMLKFMCQLWRGFNIFGRWEGGGSNKFGPIFRQFKGFSLVSLSYLQSPTTHNQWMVPRIQKYNHVFSASVLSSFDAFLQF